MAQLPPLISFTAGSPAVADDVNQNFTDLRSHVNGANVGTENIVTALLSRSGGPILNLTQLTENQIAFNVENSQSNTAVSIAQLASLAVGKATLKISETIAQTQGDAQLFLSLQLSSTIPAILVKHGGTETFKVTKDIVKPPVKTTVQRNAISSPDEGSIIYNSTNQELNIKQNATWAPVGCPVGSVQMFAGASAPQGWLLCNGDTVPNGSGTVQTITADYSQLYAILGSTYGSAGKLPDIRGMFVRGAGTHGSAIGGFTPTGTLGTEEADTTAVNGLSVTTDGTHAHTTTNSGTAGGAYTDPALRLTWTSDSSFINTYTTSLAGSHTHPLTGDTETRPANIAMNYIIKY